MAKVARDSGRKTNVAKNITNITKAPISAYKDAIKAAIKERPSTGSAYGDKMRSDWERTRRLKPSPRKMTQSEVTRTPTRPTPTRNVLKQQKKR